MSRRQPNDPRKPVFDPKKRKNNYIVTYPDGSTELFVEDEYYQGAVITFRSKTDRWGTFELCKTIGDARDLIAKQLNSNMSETQQRFWRMAEAVNLQIQIEPNGPYLMVPAIEGSLLVHIMTCARHKK